MNYQEIFADNIIYLLNRMNLKKIDVARKANISCAVLTDITSQNGKRNPTLSTMTAVSNALGIPLPLLLKDQSSEEWKVVKEVADVLSTGFVPDGHRRVTVIIPDHKAYLVKRWAQESSKGE